MAAKTSGFVGTGALLMRLHTAKEQSEQYSGQTTAAVVGLTLFSLGMLWIIGRPQTKKKKR